MSLCLFSQNSTPLLKFGCRASSLQNVGYRLFGAPLNINALPLCIRTGLCQNLICPWNGFRLVRSAAFWDSSLIWLMILSNPAMPCSPFLILS